MVIFLLNDIFQKSDIDLVPIEIKDLISQKEVKTWKPSFFNFYLLGAKMYFYLFCYSNQRPSCKTVNLVTRHLDWTKNMLSVNKKRLSRDHTIWLGRVELNQVVLNW